MVLALKYCFCTVVVFFFSFWIYSVKRFKFLLNIMLALYPCISEWGWAWLQDSTWSRSAGIWDCCGSSLEAIDQGGCQSRRLSIKEAVNQGDCQSRKLSSKEAVSQEDCQSRQLLEPRPGLARFGRGTWILIFITNEALCNSPGSSGLSSRSSIR